MRTVCKVTILAVALFGGAGVAMAANSPSLPPPLAAQPAVVSSSAPSAAIVETPAMDLAPLAIDPQTPRAELSMSDAPRDIPVEAIPAPTAVRSGLFALAVLAFARMVRRLRLA